MFFATSCALNSLTETLAVQNKSFLESLGLSEEDQLKARVLPDLVQTVESPWGLSGKICPRDVPRKSLNNQGTYHGQNFTFCIPWTFRYLLDT